jgi:hypothetical protein
MKNWLVVTGAALLFSSAAFSGPLVEGNFSITEFGVGAPPLVPFTKLTVGNINNFGWIVGYVHGAVYQGFVRSPSGQIQIVQDPLDTTNTFTAATGINDWGLVVGYFYNTAPNQYSGFFYGAGTYVTYNVPGLPAGSETDLFGINDVGAFCGDWRSSATNFANFVPFINWHGKVTSFPINGSVYNANGNIYGSCQAVNNLGWAAGTYQDLYENHGFLRSPNGTITTIDVPGATANTLGQNESGTVVLGLNNLGWISGHFWDASGYEHGFLRSPRGTYYQIDVADAATTLPGGGTSGAGLNDLCQVIGHYDPVAGPPQRGYIARLPKGCREGDDD